MRILSFKMGGLNPLIQFLKSKGFLIDVVEDAEDALSLLALDYDYKACLYSDYLFAQKVRDKRIDVPLILFTGVPGSKHVIEELQYGGDCVLRCPIDKNEALAYINATIRRCHRITSNVMHVGKLRVDLDACDVTYDGNMIRLTPSEWNIFETLLLAGGRPVSKELIYANLSPDDVHVDGLKLVDVFVCKINRKFKSFMGEPITYTVWGRARGLNFNLLKGGGP